MADPLSITCGILALITVALSSTVKLTQTIRSFQAHDKRTLALKRELVDLATVLESFHEVVSASPDVNFDSLKTPLDRCGRACEEYGQLIARFTKHSTEQRPSIRDWVTQKYLWGDMADFKDMLASYKSIISIAIANANIQVAAVTPQVLESYQVMMSDTDEDLRQHLRDIEAKIGAFSSREGGKASESDWRAMLHEKQCAQQGLAICKQLSMQIDQLGRRKTEGEGGTTAPQGRGYLYRGLGERRNVFEDITLADKSYSFTISTKGDLVTARGIKLSGGSYNVAGQITDDSFKTAIEALTKHGVKPGGNQEVQSTEVRETGQPGEVAEFQHRHGRGMTLTPHR